MIAPNNRFIIHSKIMLKGPKGNGELQGDETNDHESIVLQ